MSADRTKVIEKSTTNVDSGTEIRQRLWVIELCVEVLIWQTKIGKIWVEGYKETTSFLETLPLTSNEFNLAKLRLSNALVYCQHGDFGAAAFELRMLRGRLQRL